MTTNMNCTPRQFEVEGALMRCFALIDCPVLSNGKQRRMLESDFQLSRP